VIEGRMASSDSDRVNPYASPMPSEPPSAEACPAELLSPADRRCLTIGRVIVRWEKLRMLYNVILTAEAAILVGIAPFGGSRVDMVKHIILGGIVANVFFCAGPVVNAYLVWLGTHSRVISWLLFVMGTGLSMLLGLIYLTEPPF
jgi:hypothetical protein